MRTVTIGESNPILGIKNTLDIRSIKNYHISVKYSEEPFKVSLLTANDLYEIQHYLDIMLDISGLSGKVKQEIEPKFYRKIDIPVQIPDDSKVRSLLNWEPKIKIEKTLEDLLNYWHEKLRGE